MGSCKRYHLKIVDVGLGRIVVIEMRGVTVRIFPTYLFDGSCLQSWESSLNWEAGGMSPIWAGGVVTRWWGNTDLQTTFELFHLHHWRSLRCLMMFGLESRTLRENRRCLHTCFLCFYGWKTQFKVIINVQLKVWKHWTKVSSKVVSICGAFYEYVPFPKY